MKISLITIPAYVTAILCLTLLVSPSRVSADGTEGLAQINISAPFEPVRGVGLLLTPKSVVEVPSLKIEKVAEGIFVVSFTYPKDAKKKDTFASAMITSESGEMAFGDTRSLAGGIESSIYALPKCPPGKGPPSLDESKFGAFESLVGFRAQRRETYQKELEGILDDDFIKTLTKLEEGFGLQRGRPISAKLPPAELIERLSRINATVKALTDHETPTKGH